MEPLLALEIIVTFAFFVVLFSALFVYNTVFWSLFRDAPFVPSPREVADAMMELARVAPGETVVDLGSGHGEMLVAALRRGARAEGYELSRFLGFVTRLRHLLWHRHGQLSVFREDFFRARLAHVDVITCYLFPKAMAQLRPKFEGELRRGARVVTASFAIPNWLPKSTTRVANRPVYLYEMPPSVVE